MQVVLLKNIKKDNGGIIPKGRTITVTNDYGRELIKDGIAKGLNDETPRPDDFTPEKKETKNPLKNKL